VVNIYGIFVFIFTLVILKTAMQNQLSKTCAACGLQKPLSAFLQISGPEGTSYGNVCSTCRGSQAGRKIVIPAAEEEHSSSSTGLKIDAKAKIAIDRDKKRALDEKKVLDKQEEVKRETIADEKDQRLGKKASAEKDHRENFIEAKKSFLDYKSKKAPGSPQARLQQQKDLATQVVVQDANAAATANLDSQNISEVNKTENRVKNVDLSNTFVDTVTGEIKYQSAEFLKAKAWLGNSAAINTIERQYLAKKTSHMENDKPQQDKLVEFLEAKWEPSSPKNRR
jgi:hypothetical protein